ncbi:MAG: glycosyltransferase family 4 protein [Candidatus Heimdallarchaeota archaeon]|nr:glycosyltransferase family 4 protein [Candidatus Heimdallarchaeota archaeon]
MPTPKNLKDLKLSLVGAHIESLNQALEKRGYNTNLLPTTHFPKKKQIKDSDIIFGAYFQSAWPWFVIGKLCRKKTVCHWVGSDSVLSVQNWKRKLQTKIFAKFVDTHISVSTRIKEELDKIGIDSTVLFHGSDIETEDIPMPEKLGVLIYFIAGREKLYGVDRVIEISKEVKDVDFYFVGHFDSLHYKEKYNQSNLHFLGYINISEIWSKISVIVRMTEHDGFPKIIVEAYSKGRYVIHNYPLPGVILSKTNKEVVSELKKLQTTKTTNKKGIELFNEQFHYDKFLEKLEEICLSLFTK